MIGITQGVGFRPFLWRLAAQFGLSGWVHNDSSGLLFEIQGTPDAVAAFLAEVKVSPPPLARIDSVHESTIPTEEKSAGFVIRTSNEQHGESTPVTQDISICEDCYHELTNSNDRRFRYPFINCTNCGPRFTIIENVPYDRPATTMKAFTMCARCQEEYDNPADRRFHAQPNACSECGPTVWFLESEHWDNASSIPDSTSVRGNQALDAFAVSVKKGLIVATKGIGGFHLVCDASNRNAVATLRERKGRVDKPLAVMAVSVQQIGQFAVVEAPERRLLESKERPIVLLKKRAGSVCAELLHHVAPGNDFIGVMLPYSPMHYLLVESTSPLVVTSGNISDEPIARTNEEAVRRLGDLADCFLLHDREIRAVCDDSVVRCVGGELLPVRRSRGYAPMPIRLPKTGPSVLAIGGEIKAAFCVTKDDYAYMSQHIGDVGNIETLDALQRNVEHFLKLFRIDVEAVAGDLHPEFLSGQWARQFAMTLGVPYIPVQHHFAHACSLIAEQNWNDDRPIITCCFDGTGYGTDGAVWGGEFMLSNTQSFERFAHLSYFPLPGGDACIKRPYRTALALLSRYGQVWDDRLPCVSVCADNEQRLLWKQLEKNLNCATTSSMGRLFDAVASIIGIRHTVSYEAQAAMEMEAAASEVIDKVNVGAYSFECLPADSNEIGCGSLLKSICADVINGLDAAVIAAQFHHAVARMILLVCETVRERTGVNTIGLTGGVFQNVLLVGLARGRLQEAGFGVRSHSVVPPNDGGLALGQAVVARSNLQRLSKSRRV